MWLFRQKTLNVGKFEKIMKKKCFFEEKKRSHLSKLHLHQFGKAQNVLVLIGRLVFNTFLLPNV